MLQMWSAMDRRMDLASGRGSLNFLAKAVPHRTDVLGTRNTWSDILSPLPPQCTGLLTSPAFDNNNDGFRRRLGDLSLRRRRCCGLLTSRHVASRNPASVTRQNRQLTSTVNRTAPHRTPRPRAFLPSDQVRERGRLVAPQHSTTRLHCHAFHTTWSVARS